VGPAVPGAGARSDDRKTGVRLARRASEGEPRALAGASG